MKMEAMYDMMSYQTEMYPQQVLPVNNPIGSEGYNLPTPPHSPLQTFTDISGSLVSGNRPYAMEPVQTMPTDLSMHDHLDLNLHDVFEEKGETLLTDLPDILSNPFVTTQDYLPFESVNNVFPETEDYVPSPTPSGSSPIYVHQPENLFLTNYVPTARSVGSAGYDSDQDGSLGEDTCVGQIHPTNRRQEEYYTTPYHGAYIASPPAGRTHNYQRKTDPKSLSDITGQINSNNCRTKKKKTPSSSSSASSTDPSAKRKPSRGKGRREAMKGNHLWEFIRDLLKNNSTCPRIIRWENRQEGVFRFVNSEAVAGLWGNKKNNPNMNYEKLSRAMRYYYKREILERVDGRRLVYKFGCNAEGWKEAAAEMTQDD